ncbi:MAG: hypothetical protein IJW31_04645 [Lentisphaeria bacterium]|nr:hypothetical protein [Lentisphaeria bacterium]
MENDLTSTANSLLARNPSEAAKQGIAPKGITTIGEVWGNASGNQKKFAIFFEKW